MATDSVPAVSVIVPVYNRRDVIVRAVESLLRQDFAFPYEVVVVDDGSTDGTAEAVADIDPRVRVVRIRNGGAAAARHRGIVEARAGVVCFLDSDDLATPDHLSALWAGLHRRSDVVLSYARVADLDGLPFAEERLPADADVDGVLLDPLVALCRIGCFTASMNLMTYRDVALACTRGRSRFKASNDYDFTLRAACHGPFAFVDAFTIRCERGRPDGISRSKGALQVGFAVLAVRDAVAYSRRRDPALRRATRDRIELIWPSAAVQLAASGRWGFSARVTGIGLLRTCGAGSLRRLWWAVSSHFRAAAADPNCTSEA